MTFQSGVSTVPASIVPFDPIAGVAVVATVMLSLFVIAMVALALAPAAFSHSDATRDAQSSADASTAD